MDSLTIVLAVWGATVSTISIGWHIRRDLLDRGKLRVFCYVGRIVGGPGPPDLTTKLVYNVTNAGRRPICVTHIGGAFGKDRHFMVKTRGQMPRMLQPGDYFVEYSEDLSILNEKPTMLWAIDSLGTHWQVPRKQLRYLLREHQRKHLKKSGGA